MKRSPASQAWLLAAAAALACMVGCGEGDPNALGAPVTTKGAEPAAETGSLSFALTAEGDLEFEAFDYAITGPRFSKADHITLKDSTTVSAIIHGIPAGPGYSMTLMGTSAPPNRATCSGSAPFAITAGSVTEVPIAVACHVEQEVTPPQSPPTVPIPPLAPAVLGLVLLALGAARAGRRGEGSV